MPDTVNEVQVAFSANVSELVANLKKLSGYIDETVANLETMETASGKLEESEGKLAEQTNTVTVGHQKMTEKLSEAANQTDKTSQKTEKYTGVLDTLNNKAGVMRTVFSDALGILGMFGISVGVTQLVGQIKELADEAKRAYDNLQNIQQSTSYKYALTASQTQLAQSMGKSTAMQYAIDEQTANNIYGALLNVFPELEKDTAQLEKLANTFASVSAIEGMSDMSSYMADVFTVAKKYDVKDGEGIIQFVTDLEAAASKSAGMGSNAQELLNVIKSADMGAQYMGMSLKDTISYIGSAYQTGNGEDAIAMMSSMESFVTKQWSNVIKDLTEKGIDTTGYGTKEMKEWWINTILAGMPTTDDENEIMTYLVSSGFKSVDAQEIAKGILASGGADDFKKLMQDTIINVYGGSLETYRSSTLTGTDYAKTSQIAQETMKASAWSSLGATFVNQDELNALKDTSLLLADNIKQLYGYDTAAVYYGKILEAKSSEYDDAMVIYNNILSEMNTMLTKQNNIQPQQFTVNVQVTTDTSYAKANAEVKKSSGDASSLTY